MTQERLESLMLMSVETNVLVQLDLESLVKSGKICPYGSKKNGFSLHLGSKSVVMILGL